MYRYGNIRIDPIHYCPLEDKLRNNRNRKKLKYRTIDPEDDFVYDPNNDAANETMKLLASTLRNNRRLGDMVLSFKLAHTIRDAANADLGRAVSVCPNLRYVDLGKGFFAGDSQFDILRLELWMNCPELRTMTYIHGAERYFFALSGGKWANLETVTINKLHVDAVHLRVVLSRLENLETLHLEEIPKLNDDLFIHRYGVPSILAIEDLQLYSLPHLTSKGLVAYFEDPLVKKSLRSLTLNETGVGIPTIHEALATASGLTYLGVVQTVTDPLPLAHPPYLRSRKLQQLHFEVKDPVPEWGGATRTMTESAPADSHYKYLLASISMRGLPALRTLYVRDPSFPEGLARLHSPHPQASPQPQSRPTSSEPVGPPSRRTSAPNPFLPKQEGSGQPALTAPGQETSRDNWALVKRLRKFVESSSNESIRAIAEEDENEEDASDDVVPEGHHPLEVFTKGQSEDQWVFAQTVTHATFHGSRRGRRPTSTMSAEWDANARRSVFVTDGAGGFLAIPDA